MSEFVAQWRWLGDLLGVLKDALLTGAVLFGIRQVVLAKQSLDVQRSQQEGDRQRSREMHERSAKSAALEYASRFVSSFGPKYVAFRDELAAKRLPRAYSGPIGDFSYGSLPPQFASAAQARNATETSTAALDELEVFAAAHTTGVADEEMGFLLNGRFFCLAVREDFYDIICIEQQQGYYQSVVDLYKLWSPRISREELSRSKELLERQRAALEEELAKLPEAARRAPIGV